jgi:hypothetical protein
MHTCIGPTFTQLSESAQSFDDSHLVMPGLVGVVGFVLAVVVAAVDFAVVAHPPSLVSVTPLHLAKHLLLYVFPSLPHTGA